MFISSAAALYLKGCFVGRIFLFVQLLLKIAKRYQVLFIIPDDSFSVAQITQIAFTLLFFHLTSLSRVHFCNFHSSNRKKMCIDTKICNKVFLYQAAR